MYQDGTTIGKFLGLEKEAGFWSSLFKKSPAVTKRVLTKKEALKAVSGSGYGQRHRVVRMGTRRAAKPRTEAKPPIPPPTTGSGLSDKQLLALGGGLLGLGLVASSNNRPTITRVG